MAVVKKVSETAEKKKTPVVLANSPAAQGFNILGAKRGKKVNTRWNGHETGPRVSRNAED